MWSSLRNRQLAGLKFVRQAPIDSYFADFLCRERRVIAEIDGGTHGTTAERAHDAARTRALERLGYRVFRVHNVDVFENLDRVLDGLLAFVNDNVETLPPTPTLTPQAGRGGRGA